MTPDRIEVRGLRAVGTIGVLPEEKVRAQPFEIDLVIETDVRSAGRTDDLELTVDYGAALALAAKVVELEATELLEKVASRIAEEILGMARVDAVEVEDVTELASELYDPAHLSAAAVGKDEDRFRKAVKPVSEALAS